jgi:two-component system, NtrC family, response regulator AtoC
MSTLVNRGLDLPIDGGFVYGHSVAIQSLNAVAVDIARTNIPVLLVGESGTGKEVYARLIHRLSGLGDPSLKKLSCATLEPGRLLVQIQEVLRSKDGEAGARTLFLDAVDELDLACQRALLSLLPDGEPESGVKEVAARLISSTSRDLEREIGAGSFRRELYFRINGVCLRLPRLRERKEDIPALMEYFLAKNADESARKLQTLNDEAMDLLTSYDWPGNIRELENVAKKIIALGNTKVAIDDLRATLAQPPKVNDGTRVSSLKVAARAASRRTERELILQALERTHWNRKRAAQELQISYKALLYKIKQIGVQGSDPEEM